MAPRMENATQPGRALKGRDPTCWLHRGGQKGSAGGKNLPKIFTRQRTRLVTKTFQGDTLRHKYVSRPAPRKGGNGQDLPFHRNDQLTLLKINTGRARRHFTQPVVILTLGVACYL